MKHSADHTQAAPPPARSVTRASPVERRCACADIVIAGDSKQTTNVQGGTSARRREGADLEAGRERTRMGLDGKGDGSEETVEARSGRSGG